MKVVSASEMKTIEFHAYQDGASETDFMEEAGSGVALIVHEYAELHAVDRHVILVCGQGNNAGDAYVAGMHLLLLDYQVTAYQLAPFNSCSKLCQDYQQRFLKEEGRICEISHSSEMSLPTSGIIIDGIFGTGFHGSLKEPFNAIIKKLNQSRLPIISVDIPSGLNGNSGEADADAVIATETAFLGLPKTGFFLKEGWDHVGKLRYVDFGLPHPYIDEAHSELQLLTTEDLKTQLPPIQPSRHKYQAGYVVGLAGSSGMGGAALLSAEAALRGGAGIVRLLHPQGMQTELSGSGIELLRTPFYPDQFDAITEDLNRATAVYIGPGLGRHPDIWNLLRKLLPRLEKPCVIDADALAFLAEESTKLPPQTILTPHRGEMNRLLGIDKMPPLDRDYLSLCQSYASKNNCTVVLKGGPTFVLQSGHPIYVNSRGDPGMATAGSGDVLTGLLAALLAQGKMPLQAATLGVYIHAIAGEYAASELTSYCMTASDILFHFPEGFLFYDIAPS